MKVKVVRSRPRWQSHLHVKVDLDAVLLRRARLHQLLEQLLACAAVPAGVDARERARVGVGVGVGVVAATASGRQRQHRSGGSGGSGGDGSGDGSGGGSGGGVAQGRRWAWQQRTDA